MDRVASSLATKSQQPQGEKNIQEDSQRADGPGVQGKKMWKGLTRPLSLHTKDLRHSEQWGMDAQYPSWAKALERMQASLSSARCKSKSITWAWFFRPHGVPRSTPLRKARWPLRHQRIHKCHEILSLASCWFRGATSPRSLICKHFVAPTSVPLHAKIAACYCT